MSLQAFWRDERAEGNIGGRGSDSGTAGGESGNYDSGGSGDSGSSRDSDRFNSGGGGGSDPEPRTRTIRERVSNIGGGIVDRVSGIADSGTEAVSSVVDDARDATTGAVEETVDVVSDIGDSEPTSGGGGGSTTTTNDFVGQSSVSTGLDDPLGDDDSGPVRTPSATLDGISDGIDTVSDTLPGRTGEAFAAGAGLAAVPEPTPATEISGGAIAGGAALVGGGILASQAIGNRVSELDVGERVSNELDVGQARQDVSEIGVGTGSGIGTVSEIGVGQSRRDVTEVEPGSFGSGSEIAVGTGAGAETGTGAAGETVVPGDYPLAGRDFPRRVGQESPTQRSPEDIIGSADASAVVDDSPGTGLYDPFADQSPTIGGTETGFEEQNSFRRDRDAFVFPGSSETATGTDAVSEEVFGVGSDVTTGFGTLAGVGAGSGLGAFGGTEESPFGTGTNPDTGTEPPTDTAPDPTTEPTTTGSTGTGVADETAETVLIGAETLTGTQPAVEPAVEPGFGQPSEFAQPTEFGQPSEFAQPTEFGQPTGFGEGFGTTSGQPPSRERRRSPTPEPESEDDPYLFGIATDDETFDSGIADADDILDSFRL